MADEKNDLSRRDFVALSLIATGFFSGSVNPDSSSFFSNIGMPAPVLPFWQSSSATAASASYCRPGEFST